MAGSSLTHISAKRGMHVFRNLVSALVIANDTSGVVRRKFPRFYSKMSGTTPGDRAGDYPSQMGDFCIHYDAAGVIQNIYIASAVTVTAGAIAAVTWTDITGAVS